MKTKVRVTLVAETHVEIEVEHKEDESPTHLTEEEEAEAIRRASVFASWCVEGSRVVREHRCEEEGCVPK